MTLFITAKIIHILTAIFFVGVVSFRTFILSALKSTYDEKTYKNIDMLMGKRARSIIKINNIFLIISGSYLLSFYIGNTTVLLDLKVLVGLTLALSFYIVPIIMRKFSHIRWFSPLFHYLFFCMMIFVVILSQIMFKL